MKVNSKILRFLSLDTVGSVAIDLDGNVASAASSGGILMKIPGRVGQVCIYIYIYNKGEINYVTHQ